jgi:hypothetical protein
MAFMIASFGLSIPFYMENDLSTMQVIGYSALLALLASASEAFCNKGLDNLSIPASVILICLILV